MSDDMEWIAYAAGMVDEFRAHGQRVLGDDVLFLVRGARHSADGIEMAFEVEGGPGKRGSVDVPDRAVLIGLLARTYRIRSRRVDTTTWTVPKLPDDWWRILKIQFPIYRTNLSHRRGWSDLLMATADWISEIDPDYAGFTEVKEKHGGLRLYGPVPDHEIGQAIIDSAEYLSDYICEICGAPGENITTGGWDRTRCQQHRET